MPNATGERSAREPLSRERIVAAAIQLADEAGIEGLTMRALGHRVGVEAMTLYYHVGRKEQLLTAMLDSVAARFVLPTTGGDWRAELRASAISAHDVLLEHRWAAPLILAGPGEPAPARLRHMDGLLGCLRGAGFTADETDLAYHALDSHIMGSVLWVAGMAFTDRAELEALASDFLRVLDREGLPHLAEHVEQHLAPPSRDQPDTFAFGLDLLLDGLERILAKRSADRS
jgi:AcrR family transcriptional regulator